MILNYTINRLIKFKEEIDKIDPISFERLVTLHPLIREQAIKAYLEVNRELKGKAFMRVTRAKCSKLEQTELYKQGRTYESLPKVTNAKWYQTFHFYGFALDFCLIINSKKASWNTVKDYDGDGVPDWDEVVAIFKKHGFEWGGDFNGKFKDKPHFEFPILPWRELKELYDEGKFIEDTEYLEIVIQE